MSTSPPRLLVLFFSLVAIVSMSACKPEVDKVTLDEPRLVAEVNKRSVAAVDAPGPSKAFEELGESVVAEPAVVEAGQRLVTALGEDAELQKSIQAILGKLQASSAMQALVKQLLHDNPRASAAEIGEMVGKRVNDVLEGEVITRAIGAAVDDAFKRPEVEDAVQRLGKRMGQNPAFSAAIQRAIDAHASDAVVRQRIVDRNGGKAPDRGRATDIFLEGAFSNDRLQAFYTNYAKSPRTRAAAAGALAKIVDAPSFRARVARAMKACADDPTFSAAALEFMTLLLAPNVDQAKLNQAVKTALGAPVFSTQIAKLLNESLEDPALAAIGASALEALANDTDLTASIVNLVEMN